MHIFAMVCYRGRYVVQKARQTLSLKNKQTKKKQRVLALNIKAKIVTQLQRKNSLKHISVYSF